MFDYFSDHFSFQVLCIVVREFCLFDFIYIFWLFGQRNLFLFDKQLHSAQKCTTAFLQRFLLGGDGLSVCAIATRCMSFFKTPAPTSDPAQSPQVPRPSSNPIVLIISSICIRPVRTKFSFVIYDVAIAASVQGF